MSVSTAEIVLSCVLSHIPIALRSVRQMVVKISSVATRLSLTSTFYPSSPCKHCLMSRTKNDGWQSGHWSTTGTLECRGQPQLARPPLFRIQPPSRPPNPSYLSVPPKSSLSSEFSLVNSTRWSSPSALKKRIDGPSYLKKGGSLPTPPGGHERGLGEKSGFPFTRLRSMHRRPLVEHWRLHRRRGLL